MKRGISYAAYNYYQNMLAGLVFGASSRCSGSSNSSGSAQQPERVRVMTGSEFFSEMGCDVAPTTISRARKIVVIFPSQEKTTATAYAPKTKDSGVRISPDTNTKKGRGVGSSRRSRHCVKQTLKAMTR
ncbi:MAG: hypothetical protein A2271_00050 [Candidatus Moranbacteria bacterium RIFOXYA12_FULL_35_19]|nr:MAG: hypothetical protein UR78_C0023G0005 [Candidatus Moranbacteria bacterium GW2011_GWF2_35_39]OGI32365.1 MAG: hypothetical protein A2489_01540 [Candidatus Moranbacteria bacterium RIFOXYC12_FULL_36_13]OGI33249.1 MAG: hypothetical protein A2343_03155 [Candidatus Moranbacteria bacterium RIFOXYB12_FULL_35_8]OGI35342.1 MAG: hypothetical protein A2271_00050 [Candidatus Moranbacteria bacterium RIFOXYA12_FULL_35_19]